MFLEVLNIVFFNYIFMLIDILDLLFVIGSRIF